MTDYHDPDYPFVILDADGVCDRVETEAEAQAYVTAMPAENLRYERSDAGATYSDKYLDSLTWARR
jgi:hypothetical protein